MRVYLTNPELETDAGKQLLEVTVRVATDGKLDSAEIKELHSVFPRARRFGARTAAIR